MKIAYHLVGMVRTLEFCQFNIKSTIEALSNLPDVNEVVVFCTFWDKTNEYGYAYVDGKIQDAKLLPTPLVDVDRVKIQSVLGSFNRDKIKVDINFLDFETSRYSHSSYLVVIYESYKQRLKYELENGFFSRIVLTRPDVILYQSKEEISKISELLSDIATLNHHCGMVNDTLTPNPYRYDIAKNDRCWFKPKYLNDVPIIDSIAVFHMPIIKDFFFYGNRREMNIIMRGHKYAEMTKSLERAHTFLASYFIVMGIGMSNQMHVGARPLLIKRIFNPQTNQFEDGFETTFTQETSSIEVIHTRTEIIYQQESINAALLPRVNKS